jgi:hypothetical protein
MVNDKELLRLKGLPGGIDNVAREDALPRNEKGLAVAARELVNVDLSTAGKVQRRRGYTRRLNLTRAHSAFGRWGEALLLVTADTLTAYDRNLGATAVRSGIAGPITYAPVNLDCYWSDGAVLRRLTDQLEDIPAAIVAPVQPHCTPQAGVGGLAAGTYQVAVTNLRQGLESGSTLATLVEVPAGGGILLTNLQADAEADHIRAYVSPPNGDVLYQAVDIPVGLPQYLLGQGQRGKALETQFLYPLPAGHLLRELNGRLYSCQRNVVHWSEALRFGLMRNDNYLRIGEHITLFEPVGRGATAGIFACGGKRTIYLPGPDPKVWQQVIARQSGVVPGTGQVVPANWFDLPGVQGEVAFWVDTDGVMCLGLQGGTIVPITEGRVALPTNASGGAVLVRQQSGLRQIIALLLGGGVNALAASDSAVATIHKHGGAAKL